MQYFMSNVAIFITFADVITLNKRYGHEEISGLLTIIDAVGYIRSNGISYAS